MARPLCDFDSTVFDLNQAQFDLIERELGVRITHDQITNWSWEECGCFTPEMVALVWGEQGFKNREFQLSTPPMTGAIQGLKALQSAGHTPVIVSDRPAFMWDWMEEWFHRHGVRVPIVLTDRKTYTKAEAVIDNGLDYVIEDADHHAKDLATIPQIKRVYLLNRAYNAHAQHRKITRFNDWLHLSQIMVEHGLLGGAQ